MNKKFFEAIKIEIIKGFSSLVISFLQFVGVILLFALPPIVVGILLKVFLADNPDAFLTLGLTLIIPMMIFSATIWGKLQHAYKASKYAEKHDCSIHEALKETETYGSDGDELF